MSVSIKPLPQNTVFDLQGYRLAHAGCFLQGWLSVSRAECAYGICEMLSNRMCKCLSVCPCPPLCTFDLPWLVCPQGSWHSPRVSSLLWDGAWVSLVSTQEGLTAQLWGDLSFSTGDLSIPSLEELISSPFPNPSPTQALQPPGRAGGSAAAQACCTSVGLFYFYCCFLRLN